MREIIGEKEKADSILRCMIEGVLVLDPKGNVLVINDQAKSMFQVPADVKCMEHQMLEISRHPDIRSILDEAVQFDFTSDPYSKEIELEGGRWFQCQCGASAQRPTHDLGLDLGFSRCHGGQTARVDTL